MARSSGPDKATVKESDSSSNSSSGSGNDTDDSSDDNVEDDDSSVAEEDADDHESTGGTETPFVPGLLDDRIHISSNGKMRKAPQIAELKPDPKQKKRSFLMFFSSNIYI